MRKRRYFAVRPVVERVKTLRLKRDDFETVKIIGRGAFGEVGNALILFRQRKKDFFGGGSGSRRTPKRHG